MTDPTPEEFEVWLENPVTRWVLDGLRKYAATAETRWKDRAWGGDLNELTHAEYRVRADAYEGLANITYDQVLGTHGQDEEAQA